MASTDIYLREASLDSSDFQYTNAECVVGSDNTVEHTLNLEFRAPANSTVEHKVVLIDSEQQESIWAQGTIASATEGDPCSYRAAATGTWLKDTPASSMLKVKFGLQGEPTYVMTSGVQFVKSATDTKNVIGDKTISPGQDPSTTPDVCPIPKWIIAANDTFSCAFPALPIKLFRLEARWHDKLGSYYQFYPIAQLDFCPDNIDVVNDSGGRRDFIMTTITAVDKTDTAKRYDLSEEYDIDNVYHVADVYQVAVPHALGLHVKNLKVMSPFAAVGDTAYLKVELANIGNWFITGFDVGFYGPDEKLITTTSFDDLENRVQDTHENYKQVLDDEGNISLDENGQPLSEQKVSRFDQLGMLAPGSTRSYRIEFTIPDGLSGETDFSLCIKNPRCTASDVRKDYISDSDYQIESSLVYVDPKLHGISGKSSSAEHVWTFETPASPYAAEGEDPQPARRGDVNNNGTVNIVDAQLAYDIACNTEGMSSLADYEGIKKRSDVNYDDLVDASDAFGIQHAIHYGWDEAE